MRRVYGVYVMRQLTSPMVRFVALATAFFAIASSVSLPHVVENALNISSVPGFLNFWVVAVANTTLAVQIFVIIAFALALWTVRDLLGRPHAQLSM